MWRKKLNGVLIAKMHEYHPEKSKEELVRAALQAPIGTTRLCELAKGKRKAVIVISDHTRAVPSKLTLPILLKKVRSGNPDADVTILIATGLHRATTETEMRRMFGDAIVDNEQIAVNNAFRPEDFVNLGTLPSGAGCYVNKLAAECDLMVTEDFIEPHFFAGFSGGARTSCPVSATRRPSTKTIASEPLPAPMPRPACWRRTPFTRTW